MQNVRMTLYAPHNGSEWHNHAHAELQQMLNEAFKGYTLHYACGVWVNPLTCEEEKEPVIVYTVIANKQWSSSFEEIASLYKKNAQQQEVLYVIEECQARSI